MNQATTPLVILWLLFAVFFAVNPQIIADWRIYSFDDGTYSHAYIIPFMVGYLAWIGFRDHQLVLRWSWPFFLGATLLLCVFQWIDFAHQRMISRALMPLVLTAVILTLFKPTRYTVALGGFFWFVTPLWGPISTALQANSVKAVSYIMSFTGIPTFVYGDFVQIPAGTFEIANGCSGLRYVIAAMALVAFYSVAYLRSLRSFAVLMILALLGSMLTNWLRIVALIVIGHRTDMQAEIISDHNMFGWLLFFPLMFLIFFVAERLERGEAEQVQSRSSGPPSTTVAAGHITLLTAVLVLVSGVTLRSAAGAPVYTFFSELNVVGARPLALGAAPYPEVYAMASATDVADPSGSLNKKSMNLRFDGSIDAQRAEFFINDLKPAGWQELDRLYKKEEVLILISDGQDKGIVNASYEIGGVRTGRRGDLRQLRLLSALQLDRSSTLHWTYTSCDAAVTCTLKETP